MSEDGGMGIEGYAFHSTAHVPWKWIVFSLFVLGVLSYAKNMT